MANYEAFIRMLKAANIAYDVRDTELGREVSISSCAGDANCGNGGLYTTFTFNIDNELDSVGIWEGAPPKAVLKAA